MTSILLAILCHQLSCADLEPEKGRELWSPPCRRGQQTSRGGRQRRARRAAEPTGGLAFPRLPVSAGRRLHIEAARHRAHPELGEGASGALRSQPGLPEAGPPLPQAAPPERRLLTVGGRRPGAEHALLTVLAQNGLACLRGARVLRAGRHPARAELPAGQEPPRMVSGLLGGAGEGGRARAPCPGLVPEPQHGPGDVRG